MVQCGNDQVWIYPIGGRYQLTYFQFYGSSWPSPRMTLVQCEAQLCSMGLPLQNGWHRPQQPRGKVRR